MGEAAVRGFQGSDLSNPLSVLACAKHFVGDGGTAFGSAKTGLDQGDMKVDEATLRRVHLPGYVTAIKAGVGTIMPSYSSWNGVKCSGSKRLLTEILKGELGFEGFLISDYDAVDQVAANYKEAIGISINAGMDMVMVPKKYKQFIANLKALVDEGTVPVARIDDAVTRILRVKAAMGLLDANRPQLADRKLQSTFGSTGHRMVARQAVRESLVLLKNQGKTLPLKKSVARVHVAGKYADDIGAQCGGWTIDWQGKAGNITTGGTTLLAAIKKNASNVTYSADGTGAGGATVGVVVIGEKPYAEMQGDRKELSLSPEDVTAVENMKAAGIPVVVVLYSGRPMTLGPVFDKADALVAAWLPGTEGDGITDVLFGAYKPKGKLSYNWEKQFAFGFGLSW
jgi:beta-glucosidase